MTKANHSFLLHNETHESHIYMEQSENFVPKIEECVVLIFPYTKYQQH